MCTRINQRPQRRHLGLSIETGNKVAARAGDDQRAGKHFPRILCRQPRDAAAHGQAHQIDAAWRAPTKASDLTAH